MDDLSQISQKIHQLNKKRWSLLKSVMVPEKLLTASFMKGLQNAAVQTANVYPGSFMASSPGSIKSVRALVNALSISCFPVILVIQLLTFYCTIPEREIILDGRSKDMYVDGKL